MPHVAEAEQDVLSLISSVQTLLRLLVSSTAFRVLLSTLAGIVQAGVVEIASDVTQTAAAVATVAENVEHVAEEVESAAERVGTRLVNDLDVAPSTVENVPQQAAAVVEGAVEDLKQDARDYLENCRKV